MTDEPRARGDHYPEVWEYDCRFCGETQQAKRKGDGEIAFQQGDYVKRNYWYSADASHECEGVRQLRNQSEQLNETIR